MTNITHGGVVINPKGQDGFGKKLATRNSIFNNTQHAHAGSWIQFSEQFNKV